MKFLKDLSLIILGFICLPLSYSLETYFNFVKNFQTKYLKLFGIIVLFLFSLNIVSALDGTGITTEYYNLTDNPNDQLGGLTLTNNGGTFTGSDLFLDGANDFISGTQSWDVDDTSFSMSFEVKTSDTDRWYIALDRDVGDGFLSCGLGDTGQDGKARMFFIDNGGNIDINAFSAATYNDGSYHLVTCVLNGTNSKTYIDGVEVISGTTTGGWSTSSTFNSGKQGTIYATGNMKNLAFFNVSLSQSQVTDLNNNGLTFPSPISLPNISFQNVTIGGITNFNNTYYNSTPQLLEVTLNTTNTNNNTNVTIFMYNSTGSLVTTNQFITNNLTGSFNISFPYADTFKFFLNASNNQTSTLNPLIGNYTISFDILPPFLEVALPSEYNFYTGFNFSQYIIFNDTNLDTCIVLIGGESSTNCTDENYTFSTNGNKTINVTVTDLASNTNSSLNNIMLINPFFTVHFINSSSDPVYNFSIDGTPYEFNFTGNIYNYGLGNQTFNWSKTGFEDFNFTLEFNLTSQINQTIQVDLANIFISLIDVDTGVLITPANFTILVDNEITGVTQEFQIVNNNTLFIPNILEIQTELAISVIQNESIISSIAVIDPRQDINLSLYVTSRTLVDREFEVLNPSLSVIPNSYVFLYIYIEGTGFVLQSQKRTNGVGKLTFPIIETVKTYNICNTYQEKEKCLTQVKFTNPLTDPGQIIHDPDLTATTKEILDFISWSYIENKTNTTSEMTFIFDDTRRIVTQFCMNVTRTTNRTTIEELGDFCVNSYAGNVVQTFSLGQDQYIDYTFQYTYTNATTILTTVRSWFDVIDFTELKRNSVFDLMFLFIYFGAISLLLRFSSFEWYNVGLLIVMLLIFLIQGVINENYINLGIWGFMGIKTLTLYVVRYGD